MDHNRVVPILLSEGRVVRFQIPRDGMTKKEADRVARVIREYYDLPPRKETRHDTHTD